MNINYSDLSAVTVALNVLSKIEEDNRTMYVKYLTDYFLELKGYSEEERELIMRISVIERT